MKLRFLIKFTFRLEFPKRINNEILYFCNCWNMYNKTVGQFFHFEKWKNGEDRLRVLALWFSISLYGTCLWFTKDYPY